jgi:16S rRNA C1402 N4-methylase RsmH
MSSAQETEKLVNDLIQAEYKNAVVNYGDKYHSLHEGYAVLKEEIEEATKEFVMVLKLFQRIWEEIKIVDYIKTDTFDSMTIFVNDSIKELAQVGAVLMKILNTNGEGKE